MDKTKTIRKMLTRQQHITIIRELKNAAQGLTSLDFRFLFSIIDPPARVCELKTLGYLFHITYGKELDHLGQAHERIARYTLISEPKQEAAA
jgi:hypothetical protein